MVQRRYFEKPYEFIPPVRSEFWRRLFRPWVPRQLRRRYRIFRWEFRGTERLHESFRRQAGILLTPNHTRGADPLVMSMLSCAVNRHFFYAASWHLFMQSRWDRWRLNAMGAFSIFREGPDRDAIRESARILVAAERPIVLFPEGTWFRQNERLGPLQEGVGLVARHAAHKTERPIVVHPVALRYWLLEDPRPVLDERLAELERRLHWRPQRHLDLVARIEKLCSALLAIKEIEYLGAARDGPNERRARNLADHLLTEMETRRFGRRREGKLLDRVRRLRQTLVPRLPKVTGDHVQLELVWSDLARLWHCQQCFAHAPDYLSTRPSLERLTEAVGRIEEDAFDREDPPTPLGVVVEVGPAIEVGEYATRRSESAEGRDPLTSEIGKRLQAMLDALASEAPPPTWSCPTPIDLSIASAPDPALDPAGGSDEPGGTPDTTATSATSDHK